MRPRIVLRTHYQADEPRLIVASATRCGSPTETRNEESIAGKLEKWARDNGYPMSTPGAVYAVANARYLGLLNNSNRWTSSGLAFAFLDTLAPSVVGQQSRQLTPSEERLYLKVYLLGAGALLIKFADWLLRRGSATHDELREYSVVEKLLREVLDDYLSLATEVRDRSAIRRERDRLSATEYAALTKRHKRYPLLTTMLRLRLLDERYEKNEAATIAPDTGGRLAALSRAIPDVQTLERLIRANTLQETLDLEMREYLRGDLPAIQQRADLLMRSYGFAINRGLQACPLAYLDDVLSAVFPVSPQARFMSAEQMLELTHRKQPGEVRFHVDRRGRRAFVLISDKARQDLLETRS